ncbi:MAG: MFS transporter [Opitutae bacterium]|nr:MFS transporter [Opitutae bacterium]
MRSQSPSDETAAPPPAVSATLSAADKPGAKRWQTGTLTYSAGGLALLFLWLLWGDFGYYLKERSVPPTLQMLLKQYQVSDMVIGLLIVSLPQAITIGLAPVMSYYSDRHRGRWGRRIPFLFVPTPIAFCSMIGLAFSPDLGRWLHQAVQITRWTENITIVIVFACFWTVFELCTITCNSAFFGLINDVVPQAIISRFFAMFRVFSLGAGMLFNFYLFGNAETHYAAIFIGIGALYFFSFSLMCFKVKEGQYPPPPPRPAQRAGGAFDAIRTYFRDCFSNSYYVWIFLSFAFVWMATTPFNLFYIYFAKTVKMDMATLGKYATLQLFLSLLQAYPVGWLADKFHPLRVTIAGLCLYLTSSLLAFFLVRDAATFGFFFVFYGTITGFWLTASQPIGSKLFPKLKFASFDGARIACYSLGMMISGPLCGYLLDLFGNPYRYIYLWAAGFSFLALICTVIVYRRFKAYGGLQNYVPPE